MDNPSAPASSPPSGSASPAESDSDPEVQPESLRDELVQLAAVMTVVVVTLFVLFALKWNQSLLLGAGV